jgi:4-aminobutyrate aminotransferase
MANAASVGAHFLSRLHDLASEFDCVGQVRGRGLMIGMELIESGPERTPASCLCHALITRAWQNGLILLSCGVGTVRFTPPLCVSHAEVDEAVALLRKSLSQCLAERQA